MQWTHPERAGYIPQFMSERDLRPAREQIHEAYAHGGGWHSFSGFTLHNWKETGRATITYPGDPAYRELARTTLRDETIILFQYSWLAVVQPSGAFDIAHID